jgi:hypothetical protein
MLDAAGDATAGTGRLGELLAASRAEEKGDGSTDDGSRPMGYFPARNCQRYKKLHAARVRQARLCQLGETTGALRCCSCRAREPAESRGPICKAATPAPRPRWWRGAMRLP